MTSQHVRAFFWLRWRLFVNQMKRGGIANFVIRAILASAALVLVFVMFGAFLVLGLVALPDASASVVMYVWDGMIVLFLFSWMLGVMTELQRSEGLSLDKFLHLPVSLTSAFLINYLSSFVSLAMAIFLPAMVGLALGLTIAKGPLLLLQFPVLAAFLFLVTALTYQFQGWLASLMINKRRRRGIIVMMTMFLILLGQLPQLVHFFRPWQRFRDASAQERTKELEQRRQELEDLRKALQEKRVSVEDSQKVLNRIKEAQQAEAQAQAAQSQESSATKETIAWSVQAANLFIPPGWLALGAAGLAEGNVLPALLAFLGLTLIGGTSLWRGYRTTVRYYTGQFTARVPRPATAAPVMSAGVRACFLDKRLPWLSEGSAVVALATFRSLVRAPEAKMMLLGPVIMVVAFGSYALSASSAPPPELSYFFPVGAMAMILMIMVQLVGNQFGFDRNGFRTYVLSPVPRRDILLGKNLAAAPFVLGLGALVAVLLSFLHPLRLDLLLALPFQLVCMFLIYCVLANLMSILAPINNPAGAMKAANPKGLAILLNLALMFLFPLCFLPTLLPYGLELLAHHMGLLQEAPICLVLTLLHGTVLIILYRVALGWEGRLLEGREQAILEVVTVKAE